MKRRDALALALAAPFARSAFADDPRSVSPYAATPDSVVQAMLALADVGPRDYLIDLGSGDGRLVIAAASRGARALGVDIDAKLVQIARNEAAYAKVDDRAQFAERDLFETDVSEASVITIYLLPSIMGRVAKKLAAEMKPGARVVTHDVTLPGWRVDRVSEFDVPEKRDYVWTPRATVYLYRVPARAR